MKALSPKQATFVQEYLIDLNATQAAIRSGYSAKTADVQGPRLLGNVGVAKAIKAAQDARSQKTGLTQEWIIDKLKTVAERCVSPEEFNPAGANGALNLLGKHMGLFTDKIEVKMDEGLARRLLEGRKRAKSGS